MTHGKVSTSKGLKRKKTDPGYKSKDKKSKNKALQGNFLICNKKGHKANECHNRPKKNKKDQQ